MNRQRRTAQGRRAFIVLLAVVVLGGVLLWADGDLISPLQSTSLLLSLSSGESGFVMVGEGGARPERVSASSETDAADSASESSAVVTLTLDELTAQLAALGVDVESVAADMAAEGRSLENLLAVVNSGRVSVEALAERLSDGAEAGGPPTGEGQGESGDGLLSLRWDELGSVLYDVWVILAATVIVIAIARPVGWLIQRLKRTPPAAQPSLSA